MKLDLLCVSTNSILTVLTWITQLYILNIKTSII